MEASSSALLAAKLLACLTGAMVLGGIVWIVLFHRRIKRAAPSSPPAKGGRSAPAAKPLAQAGSASLLAQVAAREARRSFHGAVCGLASNLQPLVSRFEGWDLQAAEGGWSAAFAYHCLRLAGVGLPARLPELGEGSFADAGFWERWGASQGRYLARLEPGFDLRPGDLVLYEGPLQGRMGVVLETQEADNTMAVAEGDVNDVSAVVCRPVDARVRGRIRVYEG